MATAMFGEHTTLSAAWQAKKEGEIGVGNWDAPPRIMERMRPREREMMV